jgi:hypothetical protein
MSRNKRANSFAVAAALEKSTMGSLRGGTYCDVYGNPISTHGSFVRNRNVDANRCPTADPDLSNPTRRRTERPLETIRSFEAAIDGEYNRKRRESVMFRPGPSPHASVYSTAQTLTVTAETSGPDSYDYSSRRSSSYWGKCIFILSPRAISTLCYYLQTIGRTAILEPRLPGACLTFHSHLCLTLVDCNHHF